MLLRLISAILIIWFLLWFYKESLKPYRERKAAERKAKREEQRRNRQRDHEDTRAHLLRWALGVYPQTQLRGRPLPSVNPPRSRQDVDDSLRDREAAIKFLQWVLDDPGEADVEYSRFLSWFDLTHAERELQDLLPLYLLNIWADFDHPDHGKDMVRLLRERFNLSQQDAERQYDRYLEKLP